MSNNYFIGTYRCNCQLTGDCMHGCRGHSVVLGIHNTSNTVSVDFKGGTRVEYYSGYEFEALIGTIEQHIAYETMYGNRRTEMPKAISKSDMEKFNVNNTCKDIQYRPTLKQWVGMPDGSYAVVSQHVLVDDAIVRCMCLVPNGTEKGAEVKLDFEVGDFNKLPNVEDVLAEMNKT